MSRNTTREADLNFASDPSCPGSFPIPFISRVPSGETLYVRTHKVPLHNLREDEYHPSFDVTGFTWETASFDGINSGVGWEDRCAKEACEWLKGFLGAQACAPMNWNLRQRTATGATSPETLSDSDDEAFRVLAQEPSSASHLDVNRERVIDEVLRAFGPDTPYSTADRLAMINIWRPLKGPVTDPPLVLCDGRSLDPADLDQTTDMFGGGYYIKFNPNMKWVFLSDQMPDEILLFRQFDSAVAHENRNPAYVAHTSFIDNDRPEGEFLRSSIEVRCAVVY